MDENARDCMNEILLNLNKKEYEKALELVLANRERYGGENDFVKAEVELCFAVGEYGTAVGLLKQALVMFPADVNLYKKLKDAYQCLLDRTDDNGVEIIDSSHKTGISYPKEIDVYKNREAMQSFLAEDQTDPLVSIVFIAYNNLERLTKPAMECLLRYTTDIDYELILIDNGSTDGTLEYFQSLPVKRKKIYHITVNVGALYGHMAARMVCKGRFTKGKYIVNVPNDVLVTENWLKNMLICAESDPHIGIVVPMTDNCSNFQQADLSYSSFDDMQAKARAFNVSDPRKWEERMRIIPFLHLIRREMQSVYVVDDAFIYNFADDDMSFQYRRAGYKLIVCGDVFVHHEPSNNIRAGDLEKGRELFRQKYYGIDAWNDVMNTEPEIFYMLPVRAKEPVKGLGVDVRCGTPLLELKNKLRQNSCRDVVLDAYSQEAMYWLDLKSICNGRVICDREDHLAVHLINGIYDYIILGEYINSYNDPVAVGNCLIEKLSKEGVLAVKFKNKFDVMAFQQAKDQKKTIDISAFFESNLEHFTSHFKNCKLLKTGTVKYNAEDQCIAKWDSTVKGLIANLPLTMADREKLIENLFIREYILIFTQM